MVKKENIIGFIGIGLIGKPMVLRLLEAGASVNVWNRSKEKLKPIINAGGRACSSISQLAGESDVIFYVFLI